MAVKREKDSAKPSIYTDLALEAAEALGCMGGSDTEIEGVHMDITEKKIRGGTLKTTWIEILDETGAASLGRRVGNYVTLESDSMKLNDIEAHEDIAKVLADCIGKLKECKRTGDVLVTGLGNWNVTPDALGPRVLSKLLVTRHIGSEVPEGIKGAVASVAAVSPGVMGVTGIETCEIISGVVEKIKPGLVVAVDALAARRAGRVNATIQLTDTGLSPGSGMGNARKALDDESLGVPVIAIGVPTVVDAATLVNDTLDLMLEEMLKEAESGGGAEFYNMLLRMADEERYSVVKSILDPYVGSMFVTPKEVDSVIDRLSNIIANALNISLHPGITKDDINRYMY